MKKKIKISNTHIYKKFFNEITKIKKKLNFLIKKIINKNRRFIYLGHQPKEIQSCNS